MNLRIVNFFVSVWQGERSLGDIFFIAMIGPILFFLFVFLVIFPVSGGDGVNHHEQLTAVLFAIYVFVVLPFTIWIAVGYTRAWLKGTRTTKGWGVIGFLAAAWWMRPSVMVASGVSISLLRMITQEAL